MLITPLPFVLPPRQSGPLAITHVNVLPMDENRLLTDQTVILEDGYNRIHVKDVDDYETLTILDQPALIPDERLCITTMPLALAALHNDNTVLLALSLGREEPQVIRIEVSPTIQTVSSSVLIQQWQVMVTHPGQPTIQRYQATHDKALVSMQLEWRGQPWREIRAEESG